MAAQKTTRTKPLPVEKLRWRLDPSALSFKTTDDISPQDEIIGQKRGVAAFRFGLGMRRKGYNIFVTGAPGSGRMATAKKLLNELVDKTVTPCDLCYVNNFKNDQAPVLLRFEAGGGSKFKKAMHEFIEAVKREVPQIFESEEYIARKNAIAEAHEKQVLEFYKAVEDKVKDTGLVVVKMQMGPVQRPDVVPLVDGEPKRMIDLEEMVENGRFPREEFQRLSDKRLEIKDEVDQIVSQVRDLQKEVVKKHEEVDRLMFLAVAKEILQPLRKQYPNKEKNEKIHKYLDDLLDHMVDNLDALRTMGTAQQGPGGMPMMGPPPEAVLAPYEVNLLVDNEKTEGQPLIFESFPTYRNLFGSIERTGDRHGGWRTDFTKIKAGSFVKANGGFLVINLLDAIMEPGVWQTLKRSLKTSEIEIETYDPYYFFTATGLKPESVTMDVKVIVLGDPYLYHMLRHYDPDLPKIFKVRADFESSMENNEEHIEQIARFVKAEADKENLKPFDASAVGAVIERAVRMAGRQEKFSTAFPVLADLLGEADFFAGEDGKKVVSADHIRMAIDASIERSNQMEERIQEMIDRGSIFVDTDGAQVGQVNGLAVYSGGDYAFGKPSRITAAVSMGKEGIINIEREADMSGPTHNKGMLILSGYLRRMFAQDKPLTLAASLAFEQSYGGIDGDSASSTELYALLSALSDVPLRQDIAVTGSVNQKGEVQPIGGVNEKIEGFYMCCKQAGLTGRQGVMIPHANVKDLMLKPEVVEAVKAKKFSVWAVRTIDEGIELLTGMKAGERGKTGKYPKTSLYGMVDERLKALAEGLRDFGQHDAAPDGKKKGAKSCGKCA